MAAKRWAFDRTPGVGAPQPEPQPPAATGPAKARASKSRTFVAVVAPEPIPEPYSIGTRVLANGWPGRVFNVTPCVCPGGSGYSYVVELDNYMWGSWFQFVHSDRIRQG